VIHEELVDQNRKLNKLDDDLDEAGNKMNFVMAKLSKLLKTKDGCQIWTIVILALVLVVLGELKSFPLIVGNNCSTLLLCHCVVSYSVSRYLGVAEARTGGPSLG